jgi:hypothetical protein
VNELEPDVVMFDPAVTTVTLPDAVKVLDAYGRDYTLLGLVNTMENQVVADLFVHGARGVASRNQPKQLIAVLQREFESLQTRRQVRRLETALPTMPIWRHSATKASMTCSDCRCWT